MHGVVSGRCQRRSRDAAIDGNLDVSRCILKRCDPITSGERQECSLADSGLVDCDLRLNKKRRSLASAIYEVASYGAWIKSKQPISEAMHITGRVHLVIWVP